MIQLLLAYALKAALLLLMAMLLAGLAASAQAVLRHLFWTVVLVSVLLILPLSLVLPQLHLDLVASERAGLGLNLLLFAWLIAMAALLLSMAVNRGRLSRLRRERPRVRDPRILAAATRAAADLGVRRQVTILEGAGTMPLTFGTRQPVILLPSAAAGWNPERVRMILLHEMAHVARFDALSQELGRLVGAVHWFNPLARFAVSAARRASERACDDLVLAAGVQPADYARALLQTARESMAVSRHTIPGTTVMAAANDLEARLKAIMSPAKQMGPSRLQLFLSATSVIAAAIGLAPLRGETLSYRNSEVTCYAALSPCFSA